MKKMYVEGFNSEGEHVNAIGKKWKIVNYVYADGDLEGMAGYDIVGYSKDDEFDYVNDRIEDVIAVLPDGKEVEATLFYWHAKANNERQAFYMEDDPTYRCHGRVVAKSDAEAVEVALRKFNERTDFN